MADKTLAISGPVPTLGRIVHYTVTAEDAKRRGAHIGTPIKIGGVYPMLIVSVWGDTPDSVVNGQVFLDGNDVLWVSSVKAGEGPGTYAWPKIA